MPIISGGNIVGGLRDVRVMGAAGAPTTNVTGLGTLRVGDLYINESAGVLYIVTATNGTTTIAFAVVGAQV